MGGLSGGFGRTAVEVMEAEDRALLAWKNRLEAMTGAPVSDEQLWIWAKTMKMAAPSSVGDHSNHDDAPVLVAPRGFTVDETARWKAIVSGAEASVARDLSDAVAVHSRAHAERIWLQDTRRKAALDPAYVNARVAEAVGFGENASAPAAAVVDPPTKAGTFNANALRFGSASQTIGLVLPA